MAAVSSARQGADRDGPFQLRGNSFTMMVLKVSDPASPDFFTQLAVKVRQAPNFFRNAPVVLDFEDLTEETPRFDIAALVTNLRALYLLPVGFQGGPRAVQEGALAAGLTPMPAGRAAKLESAARPADPQADAAAVPAPPPEPVYRPTLLVTEPVRSGQQIYAEKTDLVITAPVSPGAEVVADGNIHVYGALRGRALAGVSGDANARIFCHSLEAEVVSVAGLYRVSEDFGNDVLKKAVQIFLRDGYLHMEPL
ncbi:septum site-determining protein MinC [Roseomonas genomospecies 6]|uniref:Probable septum site-determining protein MinC n=1 Tax=Roseomonas genomospecies 6 TaxID=214106 RepID=A0A9W7NG76_9PROT|nr:septum site-determining protein MinC [Roseomonas genomospecies 6]KAA0676674.1 septum site-determining protein MinC [Roseomonas genomospecies 6]